MIDESMFDDIKSRQMYEKKSRKDIVAHEEGDISQDELIKIFDEAIKDESEA